LHKLRRRQLYHGEGVPPTVLLRLLRRLGFRRVLRSEPEGEFCVFYSIADDGGGKFLGHIVMPHPRHGEFTVDGAVIDKHIFVAGQKSGRIDPTTALTALKEILDEFWGEPDGLAALDECLPSR